MQLLVSNYDKYTEKERVMKNYIFMCDWVGVPFFAFMYVTLFGALSGGNDRISLDVEGGPWEYVCTFLAILALYQHLRVSPCPLEENVEMFAVMSKIGRWVFLTRQVLCLQAVHFVLSFLSTRVENLHWLIGVTHTAAVFIAGLGIFVTVQYFTLVSPDKDFAVDCTAWLKRGVNFRLIQDFVHIPAGFIAIMDIMLVKNKVLLQETSVPMQDMLLYFFLFTLYYLSLVHVNYHMTKQWPYGMLKKLGLSPVKWAKFTVIQFMILSVFLSIAVAIVRYRVNGSLY
jgi:hypothetical protein